jgi:hypothetical protein
MRSIGIQELMLPLVGLHLVLTYNEFMGLLEIARVLGNSCRLAALGPRAGVLYGRFVCNLCRVAVARIAHQGAA